MAEAPAPPPVRVEMRWLVPEGEPPPPRAILDAVVNTFGGEEDGSVLAVGATPGRLPLTVVDVAADWGKEPRRHHYLVEGVVDPADHAGLWRRTLYRATTNTADPHYEPIVVLSMPPPASQKEREDWARRREELRQQPPGTVCDGGDTVDDDGDDWLTDQARQLLRLTMAVDPIAETVRHLRELETPGAWVGDSAVNGYVHLLREGWRVLPGAVTVLHSAHYEALKDPCSHLPPAWRRQRTAVTLLPAHDNGHWRLLLVQPAHGRVVVYDSDPSAADPPALHDNVMLLLATEPPPASTVLSFSPRSWNVVAGPSHHQSPRDNNCALWVLHNLEALVLSWSRWGGPAGSDALPDPRPLLPGGPAASPDWIPSRRRMLRCLFCRMQDRAQVDRRRKCLGPVPVMVPPRAR